MYLKKQKETFLFIQTCNAYKNQAPNVGVPKIQHRAAFLHFSKNIIFDRFQQNSLEKSIWYGFPLKILYNSHDQSSFSCCPCFFFFFSQTVFVKINSVFTFLYLVMALKKLRVDYS